MAHFRKHQIFSMAAHQLGEEYRHQTADDPVGIFIRHDLFRVHIQDIISYDRIIPGMEEHIVYLISGIEIIKEKLRYLRLVPDRVHENIHKVDEAFYYLCLAQNLWQPNIYFSLFITFPYK